MTKMTASEAKTHFGQLLEKAQAEPVTITKQGRAVAVLISKSEYDKQDATPASMSDEDANALWQAMKSRPPVTMSKEDWQSNPRDQHLYEKYLSR